MNFKFTCGLCKKEVKRGEKFRVEADCYEDDYHLNGEFEADNVCKQCTIKIENKINSLRK
tara:strand:- start:1203 stop:1382 length:180 start_codon:yes stop_codon:yes gene_type:complete